MPTGSKRLYQKIILLTFFSILFSIGIKAEDFTIEHSDCSVRVKKTAEPNLDTVLKEELLKKKFKVESFIDQKRILAGELYAQFTVLRGPEKLYKKCTISVSLRKAQGSRPSKSDTLIFEKTNSRSVPRVTFSGSERCSRAMRESFIHLPRCKPIGYAGEKR